MDSRPLEEAGSSILGSIDCCPMTIGLSRIYFLMLATSAALVMP